MQQLSWINDSVHRHDTIHNSFDNHKETDKKFCRTGNDLKEYNSLYFCDRNFFDLFSMLI